MKGLNIIQQLDHMVDNLLSRIDVLLSRNDVLLSRIDVLQFKVDEWRAHAREKESELQVLSECCLMTVEATGTITPSTSDKNTQEDCDD